MTSGTFWIGVIAIACVSAILISGCGKRPSVPPGPTDLDLCLQKHVKISKLAIPVGGKTITAVVLYPSPPQATLAFLKLFNAAGREIYSSQMESSDGTSRYSLPTVLSPDGSAMVYMRQERINDPTGSITSVLLGVSGDTVKALPLPPMTATQGSKEWLTTTAGGAQVWSVPLLSREGTAYSWDAKAATWSSRKAVVPADDHFEFQAVGDVFGRDMKVTVSVRNRQSAPATLFHLPPSIMTSPGGHRSPSESMATWGFVGGESVGSPGTGPIRLKPMAAGETQKNSFNVRLPAPLTAESSLWIIIDAWEEGGGNIVTRVPVQIKIKE